MTEAIRKTAAGLELLNAFASESNLSDEYAIALSRKVRKGMKDKVYKKLV